MVEYCGREALFFTAVHTYNVVSIVLLLSPEQGVIIGKHPHTKAFEGKRLKRVNNTPRQNQKKVSSKFNLLYFFKILSTTTNMTTAMDVCTIYYYYTVHTN